MNYLLGWLGFTFGLIGSILNAHKSNWCWFIWISANFFTISYCFALSPIAYPVIFGQLAFFCTNIYGVYKWKKLGN